MPKLDWIDLVDRVVSKADRALDAVRKKPRRRLDAMPDPKTPRDPFSVATSAGAGRTASEPGLQPLGDRALPVQIYGRRSCERSGLAVRKLQERSIVARFHELDDPELRDREVRLVRETRRYDTPYVFVRGAYVGSLEELDALAKSGELERRVSVPS
jgi:glutaredoxin